MKMHRPWQPHMGSSPLFNPYTPAGQSTTLDHFDLREEEEEEEVNDAEAQQASQEEIESPAVIRRD